MSRGFTKLGDLVKISKGKKANNITRELEAGLKRFIQIDDLRNDNNLKYTSDDGVVVQENDIIIAWDGANAGTIGYGLNGIIGSTLAALTLKTDQIDPEYLGRFLQTKSEYLRSKCTGATIPHISKDVLLNLSVPIVPIEEQHRIVKILDLAQSLIEKRKQAIAYLDDYIKAVFLDMFGDPVSNPKGWEVVKFERLICSIKYGTGSPPVYSDNGFKFIRATNIKKGNIIDSDIKMIALEEANKIAKCKLTTNDFIIVRSGVNTGDSAIITSAFDGAFAGYDLIVKFNSLVNPVFIGNLFISDFLEKEIRPLTRRAAQPHINSDQIKNLKIISPELELQDLFAEKVSKTESLKQKMQTQLRELEDNFQAELQRVFRGSR